MIPRIDLGSRELSTGGNKKTADQNQRSGCIFVEKFVYNLFITTV